MLREIIDYTEVADKRIIAAFKSIDKKMPEAEKLFSHVLNAQHIWAKRISGNQQLYGPWDLQPKEKFEEISIDNFFQIRRIIENVSLDAVIDYNNSKGEQFQNKVSQILFHLLNHSTYHRGQIATLLKREGMVPPITDYIILKRDHQL